MIRRRTGFTLIEMLTVIAIIGMLAALLMTAATTARRRARRAQAVAEVRELAKAWKSYWMIFQEWPISTEVSQPMDAAAVGYLMGENPQSLKFLDVGDEALTEGYKDPWGELYRVEFGNTETEGQVELYETTVYFPNRERGPYDYEPEY